MRNRRKSERFAAKEFRVWLGLWTGPDLFEAQGARIENISVGGARVVVANPPEAGQKVWLRMGTPACMDCVGGQVLEVQPGRDGSSSVRIEFEAPCPRDLLVTAVQSSVPTPHFSMEPSPAKVQSGSRFESES